MLNVRIRVVAFVFGVVLGAAGLTISANALTINFTGDPSDVTFSDATSLGGSVGQPTGSITFDDAAIALISDPLSGVHFGDGSIVTAFSVTFGGTSWGLVDIDVPNSTFAFADGDIDVSLLDATNADGHRYQMLIDPLVLIFGNAFFVVEQGTGNTATGAVLVSADAIPEPGAITLLGLGLLAASRLRRRVA